MNNTMFANCENQKFNDLHYAFGEMVLRNCKNLTFENLRDVIGKIILIDCENITFKSLQGAEELRLLGCKNINLKKMKHIMGDLCVNDCDGGISLPYLARVDGEINTNTKDIVIKAPALIKRIDHKVDSLKNRSEIHYEM